MEIKGLIIVLLSIGSTFGQSIDCTFGEITVGSGLLYACHLNIFNPLGFDNFTAISGVHLAGRTNADVTAVVKAPLSRTLTIPRIICSVFPNVVYVDYSEMHLVSIGEQDLRSCRGLEFALFNNNHIVQVHQNAFVNNLRLVNIDFNNNTLIELPEGVFSTLAGLYFLVLSNNPLTRISAGAFNGAITLRRLYMVSNGIEAINPEWFRPLGDIRRLTMSNNSISELPEDVFRHLPELRILELGDNPLGSNIPSRVFSFTPRLVEMRLSNAAITTLDPEWFISSSNFSVIDFSGNSIRSISANIFENANLTTLQTFDIGHNLLSESTIPATLFDGFPNLVYLGLNGNSIRVVNPRWFERLSQLRILNLKANIMYQIQSEVFVSLPSVIDLNLGLNRISVVNRNAFGSLENLRYVNFADNWVNAVDAEFFNDATSLDVINLRDNNCTNEKFEKFGDNREQFMTSLVHCTRNFRYTFDTNTAAGGDHSIFTAPRFGMHIRTNARQEIRIALLSSNEIREPIVEIIIGYSNNTRSRIARNGNVVVSMQTPAVLNQTGTNIFRVTWANNVISVSRDTQPFPFISFTAEGVFTPSFYGIRSILSDVNWSIRPISAGGF
ncbi:unnamed protein product [Chironomus riparius]|uniref:Farnesoic acid O-methyl transferase domain-containing protein n=1 Tax=Chironomus riparius TaxID=315576 RepID=A0A9N9WYG6_9DIPT|nr:unnamed protein product [Chironomus riparius]